MCYLHCCDSVTLWHVAEMVLTLTVFTTIEGLLLSLIYLTLTLLVEEKSALNLKKYIIVMDHKKIKDDQGIQD